MKEFVKTDHYGQLFIDQVLFESYVPIIFTCKNSNNDLFISVCCQNNGEGSKWLIGKTDPLSIIRLLKDEVTIRSLLIQYCSDRFVVDYAGDQFIVDSESKEYWDEDSKYLPKKDSYMYAEPGEFDEEIAYYESMIKC